MPRVTLRIEFQKDVPFYISTAKGKGKEEAKENAEKQLIKYRKYATNLTRKIQDAMGYGNVEVEENPDPEGYTNQPYGVQLPSGYFVKKPGRLGKETEKRMLKLQEIRERICYPRLGSFEVSVVSSTLTSPKLVWSKLESRRWPNVERLVNDLAQLFDNEDDALFRTDLLSRMQDRFKRNGTHNDPAQNAKLNESIRPRGTPVYPPMNFSLRPREIRVEDIKPPEIRRPGSSNANSSVRKMLVPEKRCPTVPSAARTNISGRGRLERPMSAPLTRNIERPRSAPLSRDISASQRSSGCRSDHFNDPIEERPVEETLLPAAPPASTATPVRSEASIKVNRLEEYLTKNHEDDDFEEDPFEADPFDQPHEDRPIEITTRLSPLAAERQAATASTRPGVASLPSPQPPAPAPKVSVPAEWANVQLSPEAPKASTPSSQPPPAPKASVPAEWANVQLSPEAPKASLPSPQPPAPAPKASVPAEWANVQLAPEAPKASPPSSQPPPAPKVSVPAEWANVQLSPEAPKETRQLSQPSPPPAPATKEDAYDESFEDDERASQDDRKMPQETRSTTVPENSSAGFQKPVALSESVKSQGSFGKSQEVLPSEVHQKFVTPSANHKTPQEESSDDFEVDERASQDDDRKMPQETGSTTAPKNTSAGFQKPVALSEPVKSQGSVGKSQEVFPSEVHQKRVAPSANVETPQEDGYDEDFEVNEHASQDDDRKMPQETRSTTVPENSSAGFQKPVALSEPVKSQGSVGKSQEVFPSEVNQKRVAPMEQGYDDEDFEADKSVAEDNDESIEVRDEELEEDKFVAEDNDESIEERSDDEEIVELDEQIEVDQEQYDYAEDNESYSNYSDFENS